MKFANDVGGRGTRDEKRLVGGINGGSAERQGGRDDGAAATMV